MKNNEEYEYPLIYWYINGGCCDGTEMTNMIQKPKPMMLDIFKMDSEFIEPNDVVII